jgi:hypothetical protein
VVGTASDEPSRPHWAARTARWISVITIALVLCAVLFVTYAWVSAWRLDHLPDRWFEPPRYGRGPWLHVPELEAPIGIATLSALLSCLTAFIAFAFGQSWRQGALLIATFLVLIAIHVFHWWLI